MKTKSGLEQGGTLRKQTERQPRRHTELETGS